MDYIEQQHFGSESGEGDPNHEYHVDKCRDDNCHDVIIHVRSDDGDILTTTLPNGDGEIRPSKKMRCSSGQVYKVRPWSEAGEKKSGLAKAEQQLGASCAATLMIGGTRRKAR